MKPGPQATFKTLSNGLRVVTVPLPHLQRAHVAAYVRVGSRFEAQSENGISHFLEHMLYRGTPKLPKAHDVNLAFENLGGYLYAATQVDLGVFSVTVPSESIGVAADLFSDILANPTFPDIDVERGIVREEILEDLDDEGREVDADNLSRSLLYPDHPLGYKITGTADHVDSFTHDLLVSHHAKHYGARSMVLAFSGAIDEREVMDYAEKYFGILPPGQTILAEAPTNRQTAPVFSFVDNASSQTELRLSFRAISERDAARPAMDMLLRILDDGMSTRLYHRICDERGLCYDVSANFDGYEDDGVLDFAAGVQHTRAAKVTKEIFAMLTELGNEGPSEEELSKARRRNEWEVRSLRDSPEDIAGFHAGGHLFERYETPEQRLRDNLAVTRDDIRDLVRRIVRPESTNLLSVGLPSREEQKRLEAVVHAFKGWP
ncbi:MAG: pitrilysin family protein [Polyangiaceae bacterium]